MIPLLLPRIISVTDFYSVHLTHLLSLPSFQNCSRIEIWDRWHSPVFCCLSYEQQSRRPIIMFPSLLFNAANCISRFFFFFFWREVRERSFILGFPKPKEQVYNIYAEQAVILPELLNAIKAGISDLEAFYPTANLRYNTSSLGSVLALKRKHKPAVTGSSDEHITQTATHARVQKQYTVTCHTADTDCASRSATSNLWDPSFKTEDG